MANVADTPPTLSEQPKDEQVLLNKLLDWVNEAEGSAPETDWRTEAETDYKFYAGDQDTPEVKSKLAELKRPNSTYNKILPKINMLVGLAAQSNKVPYIYSVTSEDESASEIMNGAFKHFRRKARIKRTEVECFEHAVKSGRSFMYFYLSGSNPFKPEIKCTRLPGRDVLIDPISKEYDLSDARYVVIDKWFSEDDIKALYPDLNLDEIRNFSQSKNGVPAYFDAVRNKYRLSEVWYREWEKVIWFKNPMTGKVESVSEKQFSEFKKAIAQGVPQADGSMRQVNPDSIQAIPRMRKTMRYAIFSANKVIEEGPSPYKFRENDADYFPVIMYGAFKDEDTNQWFSVIRGMRDPQRLENTVKRQFVHLLNTAQKNILVHAIGALANEEEYEEKSSEPNYRLQINPQFWDKWQFTQQPQIPVAYQNLMTIADADMKDVSGIQDPLLGIQTSSREPGVTAKMRMDTNIAVLYVLFDNFRESRMQGGKFLLGMIQQYVTEQEIIRIEGPEGEQNIILNQQQGVTKYNDLSAGEYDMVVDEAFDNVTMRLSVAGMLNDFSQNNPGTIPPELIMEYMDMPLSARRKVTEFRQQQQQMQMQQMQMQHQQDDKINKDKIVGKLAETVMKGKQTAQKQNRGKGGRNG